MTLAVPQKATIPGLLFKCAREAIVTVAYPDGKWREGPRAGELKWSIGVGSQTPEVKEGDKLPGDHEGGQLRSAMIRLLNDVTTREVNLNRKLTVTISDPQFDMLLSGYYQVGTALLNRVGDLFNFGEPDWAIWAMHEFPFGGNKTPTKGHAKRRTREMIVGWDANYGDLSSMPLWRGDPKTTERFEVSGDTLRAILQELDNERIK